LLSCKMQDIYNTSTLQSTKLLTKCTLHRIDELLYSNRADEFTSNLQKLYFQSLDETVLFMFPLEAIAGTSKRYRSAHHF